MKNLKYFENFTNDDQYYDIDYFSIINYIEEEYGISGVSESDINEFITILKERGENIEEMNYIDIANSMYDDFEERSNKDWEENGGEYL